MFATDIFACVPQPAHFKISQAKTQFVCLAGYIQHRTKEASSLLKSLSFQNFCSNSIYKSTFPCYQKIVKQFMKVSFFGKNPGNNIKNTYVKVTKRPKTSQEKSSFRSPSDAAYKSPNPSINYRPPSVFCAIRYQRQKIWVLPD